MVTISNTGTVAVDPNVRCFVDGTEADTTASTANWAVEPGETKDVPITWYHYSDEAVQLNCNFLYPDVLEPLSNLIATEAGMTSGEVSWTTAEEVEELPIVLYAVIILMVVVFAGVIAARARTEIAKQDIVTDEDSEELEEWLDADGKPILKAN